jgi:hypothetical protein
LGMRYLQSDFFTSSETRRTIRRADQAARFKLTVRRMGMPRAERRYRCFSDLAYCP